MSLTRTRSRTVDLWEYSREEATGVTRGRERTSTGELSDVTAGDDDFPKTGRHTASERHTAACAPPAGSDGGRSYCWHAQPGGLRESRGEKAARERKIQTRVQRGEGPRCLSLGSRARVHRRGPSGDSSLSSNSAVTRTRVFKVTTTRRRLQHTTRRDPSWAISLPRGKKI